MLLELGSATCRNGARDARVEAIDLIKKFPDPAKRTCKLDISLRCHGKGSMRRTVILPASCKRMGSEDGCRPSRTHERLPMTAMLRLCAQKMSVSVDGTALPTDPAYAKTCWSEEYFKN